MKNILKNKLFIIFTLFILLISSFVTSTLAKDFTYNETVYTVPDEILDSEYYCIFKSPLNSIYLFVCYDGKAYVDESNDNSFNLRNYKQYKLDTSKNTWSLYDDKTGSTLLNTPTNIKDLIYTSIDICKCIYVSGEGYTLTEEVVFQGAPQVTVTQLSQIVEQAEPYKTLAEVVGILPLILMTIVGLIGLRKALRFLQKLLRQS